jgi:sugar/nucleoside kinase (ribokinase family)
MFAGSFLYALLQNHDLRSCAEFANYGASRVVETFGPRLTQEEYREVLNNYKKN